MSTLYNSALSCHSDFVIKFNSIQFNIYIYIYISPGLIVTEVYGIRGLLCLQSWIRYSISMRINSSFESFLFA